jgi:hypothetical protein
MITPPLMGELGALVVLCAVMAAGTFVTGCLPLFFGLSRIGLRRLELWGSGLLIGAALGSINVTNAICLSGKYLIFCNIPPRT